MPKRSDLEPLIRNEWLKRPRDQRTEKDVLIFYGSIPKERPDLLSFKGADDKYQVLKSILANQIER